MGADIFLCSLTNRFIMHAETVKALIILTTKSLFNCQSQTSGSQSSEAQARSCKHDSSIELPFSGRRYSVLHSGEQRDFREF